MNGAQASRKTPWRTSPLLKFGLLYHVNKQYSARAHRTYGMALAIFETQAATYQ
jgi:hypothetical protein